MFRKNHLFYCSRCCWLHLSHSKQEIWDFAKASCICILCNSKTNSSFGCHLYQWVWIFVPVIAYLVISMVITLSRGWAVAALTEMGPCANLSVCFTQELQRRLDFLVWHFSTAAMYTSPEPFVQIERTTLRKFSLNGFFLPISEE